MNLINPNLIKKIKKIIFSKYFLFFLVFLILILKFFGLFQTGLLPSWDGTVNYYALNVMTKNYLPELKLNGYEMGWFGGFPLFSLYPPLAFAIPGLVYHLFFHIIPLTLIFRILIFIQLALIPIGLYYFTKEFLNKKIAKASILFSLFLIFYLYKDTHDGFIGAKASIFTGLFASGFGILLFLLFFIFLEKLRKKPSKKNIFLIIIILTGIILTHTLTTLATGILFLTYLFFYHNKGFLKNIIIVGIISLLLSAFYLLPFLTNLKYSSATSLPLTNDNFSIFFPFSIDGLIHFKISSLLPFAIFVLFTMGVIGLFREKKYFLPSSFLIVFIIVFGKFLYNNFPDLAFHYPRFIQFFLAIELVIASKGFIFLLKRCNKKIFKIAFTIIILLLFAWHIAYYNSGLSIKETQETELAPLDYYHYNFKDFPKYKSGKRVVDYFKKQNIKGRVFAESNWSHLKTIGSTHFFTVFLPLNKINTINGLWTESTLQNPFIMGIISSISNNMAWGYMPLNKLNSFQQQEKAVMFKRLKMFNVEYIIASSNFLKRNLKNYNQAALIKKIGGFEIYRLENFNKKVKYAHFRPGLFVEGDLKFQEFSLWWYIQSELLDFPVVQAKKTNLSKFTKEELNKFSCLITSKDLTKSEIKRIKKHIPIVQIKKEDIQDSIYTNKKEREKVLKELALIKEKSRIKFNKNIDLKNSEWLYEEYNNINPNSLKILTFKDEKIKLSGVGPIIINAGFFPYWQRKDGKPVYQITPGQMLIFSNSNKDIILEYKANATKKISVIISYLTLISIIIWWLKSSKNKNSKIKIGEKYN